MKVNSAVFLIVMVCLITNIRVANSRPSESFKGNQLQDREDVCQRCAKATKSPDAYPECKSSDKGYTFCYEFVHYGLVQADNPKIFYTKEHD